MRIALLTPLGKEDYLTNTVIDGLLDLNAASRAQTGQAAHECALHADYRTYLPILPWKARYEDFLGFAQKADLILLFWSKTATDFATARKINRWDRTVFVDGSELGGNRRLDARIAEQVAAGSYPGQGALDAAMLEQCALYFRRERPYQLAGAGRRALPLPFGIERRYRAQGAPDKSVDFTCIFGQEEYPPLRRQVRERLEVFCREQGFSYQTARTDGVRATGFKAVAARIKRAFLPSAQKKEGGRNVFYELLARTKVGISVSGGGFDTARFWEILGNDCHLMTEKVALYDEASPALRYSRISEFSDLDSFDRRLVEMGRFLRERWPGLERETEYRRILAEHSTRARVTSILQAAAQLGIG